MKYTLREKKPNKDQIILFKVKKAFYPEVGVWQISKGDIEEIYIPANDDVDLPESVEWWMEVPM
jgi:hypothetical protein